MIRRIGSALLIAWALGFVWFAALLPTPAAPGRADAVVVLTGGKGRIERGIETLHRGWAPVMYVSGVFSEVTPREFALEYKIDSATMACCVVLDHTAQDTRENAAETVRWLTARGAHSVRLVTSDWHMRRARFEFARRAPPGLILIPDAVPTAPSLRILFLEYHKLLARRIAALFGGG